MEPWRWHRTRAYDPCTYCCLSSCPQGSLVTSVQEMQTVCIVVSGFCFLSFENFPGLREDVWSPAAGTLVDVGAMMGRPMGPRSLGPSSSCCSDSCLHGEEGGDGPSSLCLERPSPPSSPGELLLVLQDPAQAATSSRKPTLISQAVCPFFHCASMSCASLSLSQRPACIL